MQGGCEGLVQLQQGLAARAYDEATGPRPRRNPPPTPHPPPAPSRPHGAREGTARLAPPPPRAVPADPVPVAEAAPGRPAILPPSRPQIATREYPQHHR